MQPMAPIPQSPTDGFLAALDSLMEATAANARRLRAINRRIGVIRRKAAAGTPILDIVQSEESPLIVEMVTHSLTVFSEVGSLLRYAEANALRAEGVSVAEIARLFGVSRQRVSALLNNPPKSVTDS